MNIRDVVTSVMLALGITLLVQYLFIGNRSVAPVPVERMRTAPKSDVHRPLDLEVDFWDQAIDHQLVVTEVETDRMRYSFSSEGAAIIKAELKHRVDQGKQILVPALKANGKEDRAFLVAFDQKTPYYFNLVKSEDGLEFARLEYQAKFDGGNLSKIFTIYKKKSQIDLQIVFSPERELAKPYRLRLLYAAPSMLGATTKEESDKLQVREDDLFGVLDYRGSIVKKPLENLTEKYWEMPEVFGGMDRYMVFAMVGNPNQFALRGYFGLFGQNLLKSYLESAAVQVQQTWQMSFYVGPKDAMAFKAVDSKLDNLMDYGILAPLSKLFVRLINLFHDYTGNFGWAIILLTILIKLVTLPLSLRGERSTRQMMEMQRKMEYAQQRYRNDPEALRRAQAEVVQKYGMGGFGGCLLPMLLQIPVFIALRSVLTSSLELYMAPFLWINNLVAADPYYILPILVGVCMFVQMSANSSDPRKQMSSFAFAIMLAAMFSGFSAGLSLYFFASTVLNIIQTSLYRRFKAA
jgi:YidC/Oxa1 family membrane protein insertase